MLHLADNEPGQDRHWIPSVPQGQVDWELITRAIAGSPYRKPIQLEVRRDEQFHDDHLAFLRSAYRDAVNIGRDVRRYRQEDRNK